jgi:hypothetical protein
MIKAELWHEIHSRFKLNETKKAIARTLGLSVLTVRKVLRQTAPRPYQRAKWTLTFRPPIVVQHWPQSAWPWRPGGVSNLIVALSAQGKGQGRAHPRARGRGTLTWGGGYFSTPAGGQFCAPLDTKSAH